MIDYRQHFRWSQVDIGHFYVYFLLALVIAGYLVYNSKSRYKFELFFISFYLLTGNINMLLTIKIPGFSLFEIQPLRFIFLMLCFLIVRKIMFSKERLNLTFDKKVPWFLVALISYIALIIISVLFHSSEMKIGDVLITIYDALVFLVLIIGLSLMRDKPSYDIIGKSVILGAVASAIVSLLQLFIDPYFLRIGDDRLAFGEFLRSNGIFKSEYYHSYFLIIAIAWVLIKFKNSWLKFFLLSLFILGILSTFHRMSWVILGMTLLIHFVFIKKVAFDKLIASALVCVTIALSFYIIYFDDFKNSALVKERLSNTIEGRKGYYAMVLENIDQEPLFGFGDYNNDVYYRTMLQITHDRDRATALTGGIHNGYLAAMFLYGIPAFVCFVLFVLQSVFYYARSFKDNLFFVIPFFLSIIYLMGNLTNSFLFLTYLSVLFAIHIGIGMGIKKIKEDLVP